VHDLAVLREPAWFPRWSRFYGRVAVPRAVRGADRVLCVSRTTADDVVSLLGVPEERVRVIPNGTDPLFAERPGAAPLDGPYLLFVGTPEPRKNLGRLLEAHALLRSQGRDERLVVVGGGGWGGVRVPDRDGVLRLGHVPDDALRNLYAHARACVYPSLWEGFGLVVGEALAAGCPVACSDLPPLHEVAGADAVYFDPRSPEDIARAAVEAADRPDRPAPGLRHSWDDAAADVLAVWRELAG
jgi:glycosyltransferase involved in cell wall biosynthesis